MPHHAHVEISGEIVDVFAHRFVIATTDRRILADLGPKGAEAFALEPGVKVTASGEMKPSELKVERIARAGEAPVVIEHKKPGHGPHHDGPHHHAPADPKLARRAVESAGLQPIGAPRRKPKHFEVLAKKSGRFVECHVELDGHIRKEKPVSADDHKWADELAAA